MQLLKSKIVLITGASSGIGEATTECFAAEGASVIVVARRKDRLIALAERLQKTHGVNILPLDLDITDSNVVMQRIAAPGRNSLKIRLYLSAI